MHFLFLFPIAIAMGFIWLWTDQIRWVSEGYPPKQKRISNLILWGMYAALMFGAMSIGVVLGV